MREEGNAMAEKKSYMTESNQSILGFALRSGDYGWEEREEPARKVILTNPEALKDFSLMSLVSGFRGTGHAEWEFLLGAWLLEAVGEAIETGNECDITIVFNTNFLAAPKKEGDDYRRFTKQQVYDHIIKFFTIQEENQEFLKIAVNV